MKIKIFFVIVVVLKNVMASLRAQNEQKLNANLLMKNHNQPHPNQAKVSLVSLILEEEKKMNVKYEQLETYV